MKKRLVQSSFTEADYAEIAAAAEKMGISPATFLRVAALKIARIKP